MENIVPFNELPCDIRHRLMDNRNAWLSNDEKPEGSKWTFLKVGLKDFYPISPTRPQDNNQEERINKYKKECLERRCCITLIVWGSRGVLIDGYHHLTAFRDAVIEDATIKPNIECWVLVD